MKHLTKGIGYLLGHQRSNRHVPALGAREIDVLKILWRTGALSVQQVLELTQDKAITLSTLQSTLERLYRKQLVSREKQGRFYVYQASVNQNTIISSLLKDIALQISDGDLAPMVSGFMDFMHQEASEEDLSPDLIQLLQSPNQDEMDKQEMDEKASPDEGNRREKDATALKTKDNKDG